MTRKELILGLSQNPRSAVWTLRAITALEADTAEWITQVNMYAEVMGWYLLAQSERDAARALLAELAALIYPVSASPGPSNCPHAIWLTDDQRARLQEAVNGG